MMRDCWALPGWHFNKTRRPFDSPTSLCAFCAFLWLNAFVPSLIVHGHFYQPPRENPWTGVVEPEPSAAPFRGWNARITAECYAPNAAPRREIGGGAVRELPSNYSRMSFNFGPTLLSWLEQHAPGVYGAILQADRESRHRF